MTFPPIHECLTTLRHTHSRRCPVAVDQPGSGAVTRENATMSRTSHRGYRRNRKRLLDSTDTCALCGQLLMPDEPWPSPWSSEADHVHELRQGGDNATGLLRAVHRGCHQQRRKFEQAAAQRHAINW